ncbi:hypothetical protein B7494_g2434 [Chlorociboria aeruginascens]|nr:hypothetical protein B7494_g2434 [Chlorociboria aeruginascens]
MQPLPVIREPIGLGGQPFWPTLFKNEMTESSKRQTGDVCSSIDACNVTKQQPGGVDALNTAIQPKLVEVGWSSEGTDDSALSEYIILMLSNGKTQEQIAAELSGDLLNLGPDDPGARDFAQWLFQQVDLLNSQLNEGEFPQVHSGNGQNEAASEQDADMGDISEAGNANVPTGPKSMRNGNTGSRPRDNPRDKRMFGHLAKAMDRSQDAVIHRIRGANERINTHARGPPTGPRQQAPGRGPPLRMQNGRNGSMANGNVMQGNATQHLMNMAPHQQMQFYKMLEQQQRMMEQLLTPQQQQFMIGGGGGGAMNGARNSVPQQGRPLIDRVQPNPSRHSNGARNGSEVKFGDQKPYEDDASSMDVDMAQDKTEHLSPDTTCKYNLMCTNKDCKFAHQSTAAPPGTAIDVADVCSFGAACKNRKCTGRHPSPAQKIAHQTEMDCKYFPNCTNPRCPFRHPTMPLCRNGADCITPNCKFTHVKTVCKFNPCLNPTCSFKHVEGQKRGQFDDKVWVADSVKEHVSERKFVDEGGAEELIIPGAGIKLEEIKQEHTDSDLVT